MVSGSFGGKKTSIEKKLETKLIERGVFYKGQFPLLGITVADFYLPRHKIAIYADGDFWHKSKWAEKQGVVQKDQRQNRVLADAGYIVFRFSESEINLSADNCIDKVLNYISSNNLS